jgi:hypothetical protein
MSDPLITALMAADGVDPDELVANLRSLAERFERRSPARVSNERAAARRRKAFPN